MLELEAKKELWRKHGMDDHEMVDKDRMHKHVQSDVYLGGMIDHSGGHMHPLNLALGEAAAFETLGGVIYEHSPVVSVAQGANPSVTTPKGEMRCKTLVLCGNAYLGHVVPELTWRIMPFSTQVMATEPLGDRCKQLLPTDLCVEDLRYILDYYRLSADKRLLFGGGTVYGGTDPADIEAKLRRNMEKVFPQLLKGVKIDYAWSGNCALSFTRVPQMGRLSQNTYVAHGYSGHGICGSHLFGRILSEAINGDLTRFDVFAKLPSYPFPGGQALRVPYSVAGSWWYGLRDRLGV
jgi:gamma-glutamylputrescine oxidase